MIKAGIIGCGGISRVHAWVLKNMEDVTVTALCDIDIGKARALAEEYYDPDTLTLCNDYRELFDMDIDVVHICTPHFLHAPMAVGLLDHKKAVFMEKPCAVSEEQFEELKKADVANSGKLGFCFQNRYNEAVIKMEELIAEDRIGQVTGGRAFVTWRREKDYYDSSDWKGTKEKEGGGVLINQSIHTLDLLLRFLGEPETVKATAANHHLDIEVEDTVEAWLEFKDGKRACFYASNCYAGDAPVLLEIQGTKGRLMMNGSDLMLFPDDGNVISFTGAGEGDIGKSYWGNGHRDCIRDFYRSLREGNRFKNDIDSVKNVFNVTMEIYKQTEIGG